MQLKRKYRSEEETTAEWYTKLGSALREVLVCDLTPAETIDWCATVKGQWPRDDWAAVRDVDPATVAENVANAEAKINKHRFDVKIEEDDEYVIATVENGDGNTSELRFNKTMTLFGSDTEYTLEYVYESLMQIGGYYKADPTQVDECEATELEEVLWYNGELAGSIQEFDIDDCWGSVEAGADVILWRRDSIQ